MKVDLVKLRFSIEMAIGQGVIEGEEIDITTGNVMDIIMPLVLALNVDPCEPTT